MHYLFILSPQQLSSLCLLGITYLIAPDVLRCFWMGCSLDWMLIWVSPSINLNGCLMALISEKLHFCVIADMCLSSSEGGEELQSRSKLLGMLDSVTDALVWVISKTGLSFQQRSTRLAHLLMLLSHIRHLRYRQYKPGIRSLWSRCMLDFHSENVSCALYTVICLKTVKCISMLKNYRCKIIEIAVSN